MQAPFYNYGLQTLGQSMHYYPPCSPHPLIPSGSAFSPFMQPRSSICIQPPTPVRRPSVSSPLWLCLFEETFQDVMDAKEKLVGRVKSHSLLLISLSSATGRLLYCRITTLVFFKLLMSLGMSCLEDLCCSSFLWFQRCHAHQDWRGQKSSHYWAHSAPGWWIQY